MATDREYLKINPVQTIQFARIKLLQDTLQSLVSLIGPTPEDAYHFTGSPATAVAVKKANTVLHDLYDDIDEDRAEQMLRAATARALRADHEESA